MASIDEIQANLASAGSDPQKLQKVIGELAEFCRGLQTFTNQSNWQTIQIGSKWWGLSRYRLYEFSTGTFISRDFLNYLNKYRAWSNCPVRQVDRDGLQSVDSPPLRPDLAPGATGPTEPPSAGGAAAAAGGPGTVAGAVGDHGPAAGAYGGLEPPPSPFTVQGATVLGIPEHLDIYYNNGLIRQGFQGPANGIPAGKPIHPFVQRLAQNSIGTLQWGKSANKACGCATDADIIDCIKSGPYPRMSEYGLLSNSCQTHVQFLLEHCCLSGFDAVGRSPNPFDYTDDTERKWIEGVISQVEKDTGPLSEDQKETLREHLASQLLEKEGAGFGNQRPPGGPNDQSWVQSLPS